jgi:chromate transporter
VASDAPTDPPAHVPLTTLARVFLWLGATSFGGPAAHIALLERVAVGRHRWLTTEDFADLLGATNLIPGPNSTEMACHVGHRAAGWPGLLVAGVCFILPAALIVTGLAWVYGRFGTLPPAAALLYGLRPVLVAVVGVAVWRLARSCVRGPYLAALGVACLAAVLAGVHELLVLAASGLVCVAARTRRLPVAVLSVGVPAASGAAAASTPAVAVGHWALFWFFLKVGSVLFGSGYVLLAFLQADLVGRYGWLTDTQLLDAVTAGQVTPGPVFTTATFVGFLLLGPTGAAVATLGIFLPAFVFVALSVPLVPRMRRSPTAGAFLDGVNVASLALMAAVTLRLAGTAVVDVPTAILAVLAGVALVRGFDTTLVLVGGLVVGAVRLLAGG